MKILMVCLGNICRSPIAEGILQKMIAEKNLNWQVASAGTNGYHTGEAPHKNSIAVCKQFSIDISHQVSRQFTNDDFENFDIIYVMAMDVFNQVSAMTTNKIHLQKIRLFLDLLYPNQYKDVTDPWYGDEKGYLPVFLEIEKCCKKVVEKYN